MNDKPYLNTPKMIVRQPSYVLFVGLLTTICCGGVIIMMILFPNDTATFGVYFVVGLFFLLGLWYVWMAIAWRVVVENEGLKFRNLRLQTKMILFKDIEKAEHKRLGGGLDSKNKIILYSKEGKKVLTIDDGSHNFWAFSKLLDKKSIRIV